MVLMAPAEQAHAGVGATKNTALHDLSGVGRYAAVLLALLALILGFAYHSGAFQSELGSESDESAHYITGLMVHDYFANALGQPPLAYAANYYLHYPKVALGHWPPVFYIMQAGWGFVCSPSRNGILVLMGVCTALIAFTLYRMVEREFRTTAGGVATAALFASIPLVQMYSAMIMSDMIVAMFSLWALCAWARYLERERARDALWFALATSAAILTKGNGFAVTLMAPLSILILRRPRIFRGRAFWMAALFIGAACIPWNIATRSLITPTMQFEAGAPFFLRANRFYAIELFKSVGPAIAALAVIGVIVKVVLPFLQNRVAPLWAAALALILGVQLFHATAPAGLEKRYLLASLPPVLLFLCAGVEWAARRMSARLSLRNRVIAVAAMAAVVFFAGTFRLTHKTHIGLDEAASAVAQDAADRDAIILCSSNGNGEGVFISELAMRERRPAHIVLRASLVLANSDWNGRGYHLLKSTPEEVNAFLTSIPVGMVVLDRSPGFARWPHQDMLAQAMRSPEWQLAGSYPRGGPHAGQVQLYRYTGSRVLRARIRVDMTADKPRIVIEN
jgi:hypothetical protein